MFRYYEWSGIEFRQMVVSIDGGVEANETIQF